MPSATACCGNDIFAVARGMTIFEMVLTVLSLFQGLLNAFNGQPSQSLSTSAWIIYLSLENYGLMKKKNGIIIVGCIIRCFLVLTLVGIMIAIPFFLEENMIKEILKGSGMSMTSEEIKMMR